MAVAYGSTEGNTYGNQLLSELKQDFSTVFTEPKYLKGAKPIEHHIVLKDRE